MIFTLTLTLFIITSIFSIISLRSNDDRYERKTQILFFLSVASFIVLGISKFYLTTDEYMAGIFFNIWGYFYLSSFLLILIIIYLYFSRWHKQWNSFIAFVAPFITILHFISIPFLNSPRKIIFDSNYDVLTKHILPVHIFINVVGELFFFFSFAGSILYLIMEWQLRKKSSMKLIYHLPNLESIENFNKWAISRALILISVGIFIGMVMAFINFESITQWTPKEIHIYFSWFIILGIFLIRKAMRVSSHKVSIINIILFIIVMFLFIFTNIFITSGFHSFR